ncbi:MAG: histidinol dehydrogenase [Defluviicoccus sp.]|nr:histidinol dehydrogenase [Defluviicoccus sp.]MDE0275143.1 histidinol dehydrogenase [Defluviicoccus sp.]
MPARLDSADADFAAAFDRVLARPRAAQADVAEETARIVADIRENGDRALLRYTARLDGFEAESVDALRVSAREIESARADCPPALMNALEAAEARISAYHARQMPEPLSYVDPAGVRLGARWTPLDAAGIYVPGGTAAYPSSVLMNAVPARIAGVERIAMAVPAPGGDVAPLVLAAAAIAGVGEIWRIGGAQAVAALAWGTETIRPVDKIAGPGNAWVAEAKRQAFGKVGIDLIAGPSEILVVADVGNDPAWIAADLLSQAEHDTVAQAILIADDARFADAVVEAAETHLATLPRAEIARASWEDRGAVIVVGSLDEAPALIDRIAPEHLELAVEDPDGLAERVRHAGAIFLGRHTPEAIGDYVAGPNHVLPTAGSARFASGLGVLDFMKRTSIVGCDEAAFSAIAPAAVSLARAEGLDAHALSLTIRTNAPGED